MTWLDKKIKIRFLSGEIKLVSESIYNSAKKIIELEKQIIEFTYQLEVEKKNKSVYELNNLINDLKTNTIETITELND